MERNDVEALLERFTDGKTAALARAISIIENGGEAAEAVMDGVFPRAKGAWRVGFTGPPGAGKSSLVNILTAVFRKRERNIGVIAVDPSSPFSGGALLGDRVRMQSLVSDPGVYVRSLASRGSLGGISNCTDEVADVLDAFGKDLVLIETVGVGQSELEIAETAHTVVVVLVPDSGDGIQAMKAGLMEIGDIFVVNKADHADADLAAREIETSLRLKTVPEGGWRPPVLLASAREERGTGELVDAIETHRRWLDESGMFEKKRQAILSTRVRNALMDRITRRLDRADAVRLLVDEKMEEVYSGRMSPYRLVRELEGLVRIDDARGGS